MNNDWLEATTLYSALFGSILLSSIGQIFQKLAANRQSAQHLSLQAVQRSRALQLFKSFNGWLLLSLGCLGMALLLWLVVLSSMPVSQAYPMLSLSYVVVMLLARVIFKEHIPWQRWLGAGIIMLGISVLMSAA